MYQEDVRSTRRKSTKPERRDKFTTRSALAQHPRKKKIHLFTSDDLMMDEYLHLIESTKLPRHIRTLRSEANKSILRLVFCHFKQFQHWGSHRSSFSGSRRYKRGRIMAMFVKTPDGFQHIWEWLILFSSERRNCNYCSWRSREKIDDEAGRCNTILLLELMPYNSWLIVLFDGIPMINELNKLYPSV